METTDIDAILSVTAATLALGVTCGGLIFAVRYLWSLFRKFLGGPTMRE